MNKVVDVNVEVIQKQCGAHVTAALIETLGYTSGAAVVETSVEYATRILEPSVNSACYYFDVMSFSVNDLFEKTGETSFNAIIEKHSQTPLVRFDETEIPY